MLAFPSMLKTSLLTGYSLLYHILKNDVHTGKFGQGVLQSVIDDIEAIATLCISMGRTDKFIGNRLIVQFCFNFYLFVINKSIKAIKIVY